MFVNCIKTRLGISINHSLETSITGMLRFESSGVSRIKVKITTEAYIELKKRLHAPMKPRRIIGKLEILNIIEYRAKILNYNLFAET